MKPRRRKWEASLGTYARSSEATMKHSKFMSHFQPQCKHIEYWMERRADAAPIAAAHALLSVSAFDPDFWIKEKRLDSFAREKKKKPAVSAHGRELGPGAFISTR